MSANTGRAPAIMIASAEYAADSGDGNDFVARTRPRAARRASASASVPVPTPTACARLARLGELLLEGLQLRPQHEPAALDHALDRRANVRRVDARLEIEERNHAASR